MTLLKTTPGLSRIDEVDRLAERTHQGQAHFANSGPEGAQCLSCIFFDPCRAGRAGIFKKTLEGYCKKFTELMRRRGSAFPSTARACRYHQAKVRS